MEGTSTRETTRVNILICAPNCSSLGQEPGKAVSDPGDGSEGEAGNRVASRLERSAHLFAHPSQRVRKLFWEEGNATITECIQTG